MKTNATLSRAVVLASSATLLAGYVILSHQAAGSLALPPAQPPQELEIFDPLAAWETMPHLLQPTVDLRTRTQALPSRMAPLVEMEGGAPPDVGMLGLVSSSDDQPWRLELAGEAVLGSYLVPRMEDPCMAALLSMRRSSMPVAETLVPRREVVSPTVKLLKMLMSSSKSGAVATPALVVKALSVLGLGDGPANADHLSWRLQPQTVRQLAPPTVLGWSEGRVPSPYLLMNGLTDTLEPSIGAAILLKPDRLRVIADAGTVSERISPQELEQKRVKQRIHPDFPDSFMSSSKSGMVVTGPVLKVLSLSDHLPQSDDVWQPLLKLLLPVQTKRPVEIQVQPPPASELTP